MLTSVGFASPKFIPKFLDGLSSSKKSFPTSNQTSADFPLSPDITPDASKQSETSGSRNHIGKLTQASSETNQHHEHPVSKMRSNQSTMLGSRERPLRRPTETAQETNLREMPLHRPSEIHEDVAFSDCVVAIAVDVSGSTGGIILSREREVINNICNALSGAARNCAQLIPWSDHVSSIISVDGLHFLDAAGGTVPSRLISMPSSRQVLCNSSAWFLLTDGEILDEEVRDFAHGICEHGLHGTACVIILFGYKTPRPMGCNISIGLSVFGTTSDCLFLFHDVDTGQVYILQSKGYFNAVLPAGHKELLLDQQTLWSHLPTFKYEQLFQLSIPTPQKLNADSLRLQSRKTVDLEEIYQHRIDATTASEILENDDNLKTVLLSAQLRGRDDEVREWIAAQTLPENNLLLTTRLDVGSRADISMRRLLSAISSIAPSEVVERNREALRFAHKVNWSEFTSTLNTEQKNSSRRTVIVGDAIRRIDLNRTMMVSTSPRPNMLSPVSPGPPVHRPADARSLHMDDGREEGYFDNFGTDLLYIPGYRYNRMEDSDLAFEGKCTFCQEQGLLLLLLKAPPRDLTTPGFPQPGSRIGLVYPLAMGTFPEVDILSSHLCCDSCAAALIRGKMCLKNGEGVVEEFVGAIPLISTAFSGEFEKTSFHAIDSALEQRFDKSAVELVFLAILYNTLCNIVQDDELLTAQQRSAIQVACSMLSQKLYVPEKLSVSITGTPGSPASQTNLIPLVSALSRNFAELEEPDAALLQYPVGGFVVMILIATDLKLELRPGLRELAVWHRFLFHLVQKHCLTARNEAHIPALPQHGSAGEIESSSGTKRASPLAPDVQDTFHERAVTIGNLGNSPTERKAVTIESISNTPLLAEEDLEQFRRLGPLFGVIEQECSSALATFLQCLTSRTAVDDENPMEIFNGFRNRQDLVQVFALR